MGYEQSVLRRATARLEAQRKAREEAQERLRSEIYTKLPRVAAIDRELRRTITQIIAASLRDGSDPVPAIGVIRDKNLSLQAEKAALLTEHGYPADALDDKPACPKCSDTGWVGANMCACLKALCTEEQIRELSKLLDLGEQSFDSFSLDYYSPLPWPGESLSPRENMEFIFDVCSSYARKFGRFYFRNLFLTGAPGLGKTFLSACIARTVSESGFSVVYDTAVNIFTRFEEQKFARDKLEAGEAKDETRRYLGCDLLILDDLGSELSTPFVQSALYTLINTRLTADKRTVISSNLTMDQVRARYTPQIASRLEGEYRVLPFYGEDIRLLRKQRLRQGPVNGFRSQALAMREIIFSGTGSSGALRLRQVPCSSGSTSMPSPTAPAESGVGGRVLRFRTPPHPHSRLLPAEIIPFAFSYHYAPMWEYELLCPSNKPLGHKLKLFL